MTELASKAVELIQAVGDSYVRLLAFIALVIVVSVFSLHQGSSKADRMEISWGILVFGIVCVIAVILMMYVSLPQTVSTVPALRFSLVNWLGVVIGGIGLIELVSSIQGAGNPSIRVNPGLPLLALGVSLIFWIPTTNALNLRYWVGVAGRLIGASGFGLLLEGLLYSSHLSLRFEDARNFGLGFGSLLLIAGILLTTIGA